MTAPARLFHLVLPGAWDAFERTQAALLAPPSLESEGFVHLSFAAQLAGTLATHFTAHPAVELLEVVLPSDCPELRLEPSRDEALFPHLYRPLARAELARRWSLRAQDGAWSLPALAERAQDDEPLGQAPPAV